MCHNIICKLPHHTICTHRQLTASPAHIALHAARAVWSNAACKKASPSVESPMLVPAAVSMQVYDTAAHSRIGKLDRPKSRSVLSGPASHRVESRIQ